MAATNTTALHGRTEFRPISAVGEVVMCPRRRRISPEAGRALEILGHAIEYLTDEYVFEGGCADPGDPRLQAVNLLMATNREIYLGCPEVHTLTERCLSWLQGTRAA